VEREAEKEKEEEGKGDKFPRSDVRKKRQYTLYLGNYPFVPVIDMKRQFSEQTMFLCVILLYYN